MDLFAFGLFLVTCGAAAATGAMFPPGAWYQQLNKPVFVPPNWVFPLAWTTIYLLISYAGARVVGMPDSGYAVAFWGLQAAFSVLWTPVFFGLRRMKGALPVMALLWIAVLGCLVTHWRLDLWAGLAFVPYMIWVTVAAALNVEMARLNPDAEPVKLHEL